MSTQPKALSLADWLDEVNAVPHPIHTKSAAAELRRLHGVHMQTIRDLADVDEENEKLREVNAELVEALRPIAELGAINVDIINAARAAIAKATGEQQ